MKYTYGTSNVAAERLRGLSSFFNTFSGEFIRQFSKNSFTTAVDLGCGPGFTTEMVATTSGCKNIAGIDRTENFLQLAQQYFPQFSFYQHDVTQPRFPFRGDLMYTRFLLAHLPHVEEVVNLWISELEEGGRILIEELEAIQTEVSAFQEYLEINNGLVGTQGGNLYIGEMLAQGKYHAKVVHNDCFTIPVENRQAANWFLPTTLSVWEEDAYILKTVEPKRRKRISREIAEYKESNNVSITNTWVMRRLVLEKS